MSAKVLLKYPKFTLSMEPAQGKSGVSVLKFDGYLNEAVPLAAAAKPLLESDPWTVEYSFDTTLLNKINSVGLRQWISFVSAVEKERLLRFSVLSEPIVEAADAVISALGGPKTQVEAIAVPYFCGACDLREVDFVPTSKLEIKPGVFSAPDKKCAKCGKPMSLDALEEEYFICLKDRVSKSD